LTLLDPFGNRLMLDELKEEPQAEASA